MRCTSGIGCQHFRLFQIQTFLLIFALQRENIFTLFCAGVFVSKNNLKLFYNFPLSQHKGVLLSHCNVKRSLFAAPVNFTFTAWHRNAVLRRRSSSVVFISFSGSSKQSGMSESSCRCCGGQVPLPPNSRMHIRASSTRSSALVLKET